jgi:anti-sigma regulatory factor (Ser/Thr protein kinase)
MAERVTGSVEPAADTMSYSQASDLSAVRAFVRAAASALGLSPGRVDMLLLAVSELATNTLQHTSGAGRVRVWADGGQVVCDVMDTGADRSFGPMPEAEAERGRGLAIVKRIADAVSTVTRPEGMLVRVRMNL